MRTVARLPHARRALFLLGAVCLPACTGDSTSDRDGGETHEAGGETHDDASGGASDGGGGSASDAGGSPTRDGGSSTSSDASTSTMRDGSTSSSDASTSTTRDGGTTTSSGSDAACLAASLLDGLKLNHMLVGASMSDDTASAAPFDAQYLYLAGGLFDGNTACSSCASGCTANGTSCANSAGCSWWGCWQSDQEPPGAYARDFVSGAKAKSQIPMITYYEVLQGSGASEGSGQVGATNDAAFMRRYLADFAFVMQQIGNERALVHIEPDFWAYAQQVNNNPASIPAKVGAVNDDCKSFENNFGGLGRCLIHLVRKYAPNARVGLHGSSFATGNDVLGNTDPNFDVAGEARKLGMWLLAVGAGDSDFVVVDASDRDAAWYDTQGRDSWWDDTNKTLPNFKQAFAWTKSLAETVKKPVLWWQVPVGNMRLPNQNKRWKDNRLDYFFDHPDEVVAAHGAGVLFGGGDDHQTTPETDDGHLIARMKAYAAKPQAPCR